MEVRHLEGVSSRAPVSSPIISGLQRQGADISRGLRPEGTTDWLLVATLSGTGYVRAEGRLTELRRGQMLLIAPRTPQEYGHRDEGSRWVNIWVHFRPRPHWLTWLDWPRLAEGVMLLDAGGRLSEIEAELQRMVEVAAGPLRLSLDASMNALERVLILADDGNPAHEGDRPDDRIRRALELIGERLAEPLSVEQLSREAGLSRSRFTALFAEQMRIGPQAYVEAARLSRAAQMLVSSGWSIGQVADEVGFRSAFYFSTRFRRHYGLNPRDYRARFTR